MVNLSHYPLIDAEVLEYNKIRLAFAQRDSYATDDEDRTHSSWSAKLTRYPLREVLKYTKLNWVLEEDYMYATASVYQIHYSAILIKRIPLPNAHLNLLSLA